MKKPRSTAEQLSKKLGISRASIFALRKQHPTKAPKTFDAIEQWRSFALEYTTNPDAVCRLCR
jgi:hypothetical protein